MNKNIANSIVVGIIIFVWIIIIGLIAGIGLFAFNGFNVRDRVRTNLTYNDDTELVSDQHNVSIDNINNIKINTVASNIKFIGEDREDVFIDFKTNITGSNKPNLYVDVNGDTLNIEIRHKKDFTWSWSLFNNGFNGKMNLDVRVPKSYIGNLKIDTTAGNIGIETEELNKLTCDFTAGNIEMGSLKANIIKLNSTAGNVDLGTIECNDVNIDTTAGNVKIRELTGGLEADTTAGNINVNFKKVTNDVKVDATTGNISITVPSDSSIRVNADSTLGHIGTDLPLTFEEKSKKSIVGYMGDSEYKVNLSVTTGNISIEK